MASFESIQKTLGLIDEAVEPIKQANIAANKQAAAKAASTLYASGDPENQFKAIDLVVTDPIKNMELKIKMSQDKPEYQALLAKAKEGGTQDAKMERGQDAASLQANKLASDKEIAGSKATSTKNDMRAKQLEDKQASRAIVADKQVENINSFDKMTASMDAIEDVMKDKFIGPVRGNVPKLFTSGEEEAFRAKIGRVTDSYRSLVTGAAAADKELARIESRLPKIDDKPEQFKAKMVDVRKEVEAAKQRYLTNLERKGKDVGEFRAENDGKPTGPVKIRGVNLQAEPGRKVLQKSTGKIMVVQPDGSLLPE